MPKRLGAISTPEISGGTRLSEDESAEFSQSAFSFFFSSSPSFCSSSCFSAFPPPAASSFLFVTLLRLRLTPLYLFSFSSSSLHCFHLATSSSLSPLFALLLLRPPLFVLSLSLFFVFLSSSSSFFLFLWLHLLLLFTVRCCCLISYFISLPFDHHSSCLSSFSVWSFRSVLGFCVSGIVVNTDN